MYIKTHPRGYIKIFPFGRRARPIIPPPVTSRSCETVQRRGNPEVVGWRGGGWTRGPKSKLFNAEFQPQTRDMNTDNIRDCRLGEKQLENYDFVWFLRFF